MCWWGFRVIKMYSLPHFLKQAIDLQKKNTITTKSTACRVYRPSFHIMKCQEVLSPDNLSSFRNTPSKLLSNLYLFSYYWVMWDIVKDKKITQWPGQGLKCGSSAQFPMSKTQSVYVRPPYLPQVQRACFYVCLFYHNVFQWLLMFPANNDQYIHLACWSWELTNWSQKGNYLYLSQITNDF